MQIQFGARYILTPAPKQNVTEEMMDLAAHKAYKALEEKNANPYMLGDAKGGIVILSDEGRPDSSAYQYFSAIHPSEQGKIDTAYRKMTEKQLAEATGEYETHMARIKASEEGGPILDITA